LTKNQRNKAKYTNSSDNTWLHVL